MVEAYKPLYTVAEAAKVLKVNKNTMYDLINSGQLRGMKLGTVKIKGCELESFINAYPAMERKEAAG